MKIKSGSFGLVGSAFVHKEQTLIIEGVTEKTYKPADIVSINASTDEEKKFSVFSMLIGLAFTGILTLFFNLIGFGIGLVITFLGSKYSVKHNVVTVEFNDNKNIALICTPNETKKLFMLNR